MRLIAVLLSALALAGCSATAYKGGYGDSQVSQNVFKIDTRVNGFSPRQRAEEIAMLRASEITCLKGYQYFDVISEETKFVRKLTYKFMTIELKDSSGRYDAKIIMRTLQQKLDTKTTCSFT